MNLNKKKIYFQSKSLKNYKKILKNRKIKIYY